MFGRLRLVALIWGGFAEVGSQMRSQAVELSEVCPALGGQPARIAVNTDEPLASRFVPSLPNLARHSAGH